MKEKTKEKTQMSPLAKKITEATAAAFKMGYEGVPNRFPGSHLGETLIGASAPLYNHLLKRAYTCGLQLRDLEKK